MSDPRWPDGSDPNQYGRPQTPGEQYPSYTDPAYAGQYSYPSYSPPPNPTEPLPPYWTQTQYPQPEPEPESPPPSGGGTPRWLWLLAGVAVLLVIGLVIALVIANSADKRDSTLAPLPSVTEPTAPTTTRAPTTTTRRPTTTRTPTTTPGAPGTTETSPPTTTTTTDSDVPHTVVYRVEGTRPALSITYIDTGGVLQMEFNVALPWTREVSLTPPASDAASVTVVHMGSEVTCTVTVDGVQVSQRSGQGLTICSAVG